jgi:carbon-monoxide dehydrogenase medium subunit
MLHRFAYLAPDRLDEALDILTQGEGRTKVLAGGTDLLVRMKEGAVRPDAVLDIGRLEELRGIRLEDRSILIGPLTTHEEIDGSELIRRHAQALAQGAAQVGSPQIRHRATIGGNLVNASPAADTVPPLFVHQAEVQVSSVAGNRWLAVEDFFTGPGATVLAPGELVTGLRLPLTDDDRMESRYEKFGTRNALSVAVASVAAASAREPDGRLNWIRIALGSVSPMVLRAGEAERLLTGEVPGEELATRAAGEAAGCCCPIDDVRGSAWYRRQLVAALLIRILRTWAAKES